jgi:chromosome segregation ATPase
MDVSTQTSEELEQINDWKAEIESARDAIRSMRSQLEQMVLRTTDEDDRVQIEHFQNQFIRQMEVADEMHHDLRQSAKKINGKLPVLLHDDKPVEPLDALNDRMSTFRKLYNELQHEFGGFIAFS